nr:non-homologous end-joining DNA ligase [Kofleriaceae bacterium]
MTGGSKRGGARTASSAALVLARRLELAAIGELPGGETCDGWLVEPAWDGHRVLATRDGADVRLAAADLRDWTATFPPLARALGSLACTSLAIDGVVCALDARGVPRFAELRARVAAGVAVGDAILACWDLLWLDGADLRARPLSERRTKLAALLAGTPAPLVASPAVADSLSRVVAAARDVGMRGVVARARDGVYGAAWYARAADEPAAPLAWDRPLSAPPPVTNADKVLYPRDALTKRDLVAYYRDVAPALVPLLADRPVVIQRWPDGIDDFAWYQHRVPPRAPDYLRAAWVDGIRRIVVDNVDALLWLVNQAGLTFHGFASRLAALAEPDFAVIDLDPGDRTTWADTVDIARAVRRSLELLELPCTLKTSGQRGVHVLVPLAGGHTFAQAERLGDGVADLLLRLMPDRCTRAYDKDKRGGRLLVDTRQFAAKTLVVPYSLRAVDGATVSTPLRWDELDASTPPGAFTLRTVRARLDRHGDLAAPLRAGTARLDAALAQLDAQRGA